MEENKVRYSDEELEEFRQLINEKLAVAKSDYEVLMQKINGDGVDEAETHSTYHTLEEGSETLSKESLMNEVMRAQKFKERLRAVPHATLSIEAKQARDKKK